jgi:hypothetical protein
MGNFALAFVAARCFSFLAVPSASSPCSGIFCQNSEFGASTFSPPLSLPLRLSSTQTFLNEVIKSRGILTQSAELKGCKFLSIRDSGASSSATLHSCQAGGAISALVVVSILSTAVISCQARSTGALECRDQKPREVSLASSTFDRPRADIIGCLLSNKSDVSGASCNFSGSTAANCIGFFIMSYVPIDLRMCDEFGVE